jgi:hypothetical protein
MNGTDILIVVAVLLGWMVLQSIVLPRLGVPT